MATLLPTSPIDDDIYTGLWINHAQGDFRGARLTLSREAGGLVIAFLALFIAVTARGAWKLARYVLFVAGSSSIEQDGTYHQRQAVLRNGGLAFDALWDLVRLGYAWRGRARKIARRLLPSMLLASTIALVSVVAGILSSRLLTASDNEALISGRRCGTFTNASELAGMTQAGMIQYQSGIATNAYTYASQCYNQTVKNKPVQCNKFMLPYLPHTIDSNSSCPFAEDLCRIDRGNLLLDSGKLDSSQHLGLNIGPRFTLQYRTHCAPLQTSGYTDIVMDPSTSKRMQVYRYGSRGGPFRNQSYVYAVEADRSPPVLDPNNNFAYGNYRIQLLRDLSYYKKNDKSREFTELIPQLVRPNVDTALLFLDSSELFYQQPTKDPWFSATTRLRLNSTYGTNGSWPYYAADEPVGVLGCGTETQICNPNLSEGEQCFDGSALRFATNETLVALKRVWPDAKERSELRAFFTAINRMGDGTGALLYTLPSVPAFLSRNTILGNLQTDRLPEDRWQAEMVQIFKTSLAIAQHMLVEHARGMWLGYDATCYQGVECKRLCHSQKIRSTNHYSFSAWALGLVLFFGIVIIIVSTFVDELYTALLNRSRLRRNSKLVYSGVEWRAASTLQTQRMAHENLGLGTWTRTDGAFPVTERGEMLGSLDVTDSKHPRMTATVEGFDSTKSQQDHEAYVGATDQRYSRLSSIDTSKTTDAPRLPSIDTGSIALSELIDNPDIREPVPFSSKFSKRYSRLPNSQESGYAQAPVALFQFSPRRPNGDFDGLHEETR